MFRRRLRLLAAAGTGLLIAAVSAVAPSAAAPRLEDPVVDVTIESFAPAALTPGEVVRITGRVHNTSGVTLDQPQALVCLQQDQLATRAELAAIPPEDDGPINDQTSCTRLSTVFQVYNASLAPNATVRFDFTVRWDQWRIPERPGVYVVGVQFRATVDGGGRITAGRARTLMPVVSRQTMPRKVNTAVMLPLVHRPTLLSGNQYLNESLGQAVAPTGSLGRMLAAGRGKKVTWLVDPAMLDEIEGLAHGYTVLGPDNRARTGTGVRQARDWLAQFKAARASNPVVLLPYGDADVAGLIDAGGELRDLVSTSRETTAKRVPPGAKSVRSGLWLEPGSASARSLAAGSTGFVGRLKDADLNLLSSWSWPLADRPSLSPSPVYDVATPGETVQSVRTVVADSALTAGGPDPASAGSALQLRQRFVAETALLAAGGSGPITVVAAPGRGTDAGPVQGLLVGLSMPWITQVGVDEVLSSAGATPQAAKPPTAPRSVPSLAGGHLEQVKRLDGSIDAYRSLLANPDPENARLNQSLLQATSLNWRGWSREAQRFVGSQQRVTDLQLGKVHLVRPAGPTQGSHREIRVNLSGSNGRFPLTIANELDQSVRVGVKVQSLNRTDLRIQPVTTVTLQAKGKATFKIEASAEQNGLIRASAQVVSADGYAVGPPQELVMQATQYGSVGWILVGAAMALLFGTSLVRIYRRLRSERRNPSSTEEAPGVDPLNPWPPGSDALHPRPVRPHDSGAPSDALTEPGRSADGLPGHSNGVPRPAGADSGPAARHRTPAPLDVPAELREGAGTKDG